MIGVSVGVWTGDAPDAPAPPALAAKLAVSNRRNLGSTTVMGAVIPTRATEYDFQFVINTYLNSQLTAQEVAYVLRYRHKYVMSIGVGDRRNIASSLIQRFAIANNWSGENASSLLLTPEIFPTSPYSFRLSFSAETGKMLITDTHSVGNTYGGVRYMTLAAR